MKPFEFVLVIISIIIGLAFAEFANEVAYMIKNYKTSVFSLPYLLIMITGVIGGLNYWSTIYMTRKLMVWDNLKIGLMFLSSLTYYIIARVYLPDSNSFNGNYAEFYHEVIGISLFMMICWIISIMFESYFFKKDRPLKWYIVMSVFVLLIASGVFITNRVYREVLSFILFGLQAINLVVNKVVIKDDEPG